MEGVVGPAGLEPATSRFSPGLWREPPYKAGALSRLSHGPPPPAPAAGLAYIKIESWACRGVSSGLPARMPAAKVWIREILEGRFEDVSVGTVRYFRLPTGGSVVSVRVMGVVVDSYMSSDAGHARVVLEDGTGSISVRAWDQDVEMLVDPETGSPYPRGTVLDVVGRVREWRGERYVVPQLTVRVEDPNWILVRTLEILRERMRIAAAASVGEEVPEGEPSDVREAILKLLHEEGPLSEEQIVAEFSDSQRGAVLRALDRLMEEGLIYLDERGRYVVA